MWGGCCVVVEIKTPGEIEAIRAAGQVVAQVLAAVRAQAAAGTRLADLDEAARGALAQAGATSPFLGYQPAFAPSRSRRSSAHPSTTPRCTASPAVLSPAEHAAQDGARQTNPA
jgi:hypothetical protein